MGKGPNSHTDKSSCTQKSCWSCFLVGWVPAREGKTWLSAFGVSTLPGLVARMCRLLLQDGQSQTQLFLKAGDHSALAVQCPFLLLACSRRYQDDALRSLFRPSHGLAFSFTPGAMSCRSTGLRDSRTWGASAGSLPSASC